MTSKHVVWGFILAFGLVSCQGQPLTSPSPEETTPEIAANSQAVVKKGNFVDAERPTSGNIQLVESENSFKIEFSPEFETKKGPDLQVILHRSSDLLSELSPPTFSLQASDYVVLGKLKTISGTQTYNIPSDINLDDYGSVAIWCQKFNATFGAANLDEP